MTEDDIRYFQQRILVETALAKNSANAAIAAKHRQFAVTYGNYIAAEEPGVVANS